MGRVLGIFFISSLIFANCVAAQVAADEADPEIVSAVEDYFAAITVYDREALARAFHPEAMLWASIPRGLYRSPFQSWSQFIERGRPDDADEYENRIVWIDQTGDAAVAKVDLLWPGVRYVDYLSLVKTSEGWRIVNKIWHQEPRS